MAGSARGTQHQVRSAEPATPEGPWSTAVSSIPICAEFSWDHLGAEGSRSNPGLQGAFDSLRLLKANVLQINLPWISDAFRV